MVIVAMGEEAKRKGERGSCACLHEGVVDGHDEDFASVFEFGVGNIAGNVGVGACWACE